MPQIPRPVFTLLSLFAGVSIAPGTAHAETYNTCAGFIDSVPANITTQGVWCLRKNLGSAITSGNTITIATNNGTIDCNDFKLGGLAAGESSQAFGVYANNQQNVAVRHCNVRGFNRGIYLSRGAGHLVENNRLDNNLYIGISVSGDNNLVQRNRVFDTGGATNESYSYSISATADILDNTVAGVFGDAGDTYPVGIEATMDGAKSVAIGCADCLLPEADTRRASSATTLAKHWTATGFRPRCPRPGMASTSRDPRPFMA